MQITINIKKIHIYIFAGLISLLSLLLIANASYVGHTWSELHLIPTDINDGDADDWSEISSIPADIADGDADDWSEISSIPADIADGDADDWSEISSIPADIADGDADDWSEISSIPAGFADGVDDSGGSTWENGNVAGDFDITCEYRVMVNDGSDDVYFYFNLVKPGIIHGGANHYSAGILRYDSVWINSGTKNTLDYSGANGCYNGCAITGTNILTTLAVLSLEKRC